MLFKDLAAAGIMLCVALATPPVNAGTYIDASSFDAALIKIPAVHARNLVPYRVTYRGEITSWGGQMLSVPVAAVRSGRTDDGRTRQTDRNQRTDPGAGASSNSSNPHVMETLYERVFVARMNATPSEWLAGNGRDNGTSNFLLNNAILVSSLNGNLASEFQGVGSALVRGLDVIPPVNVPEPTSFALFGAGLLGLGLIRRSKATRPA